MIRLSKSDALNLGKALSRADGLDDLGYLNDLVVTVTNVASSRSIDLEEVILLYEKSGGRGSDSLRELFGWDRRISDPADAERYLGGVEDFVVYLIEERAGDKGMADPRRQREAVNLISAILGEMGAGIEPKDLTSRLEKVSLYDGEGNFSKVIELFGIINRNGTPLASEESRAKVLDALGDSPLSSLLIQNDL
ncbi:MAG: hypothetical protein M0019_01385 [Actinomycetota bacterium]|nr:hypothetical protein [Actinomycetota bacterium]